MGNIASMSAIVAALSGADVGRLHLTWNHVNRSTNLEPLVKLMEQTSNFSHYRRFHRDCPGPCVPYISQFPPRFPSHLFSFISSPSGVFLTDLKHADEMPDHLVYDATNYHSSPMSSSHSIPQHNQRTLVNFTKRKRFAEAINQLLKFQPTANYSSSTTSSQPSSTSSSQSAKQYSISDNPALMTFIESQVVLAASKDHAFFWQRSQDLQSAEVAHADIRKGLEAAGF